VEEEEEWREKEEEEEEEEAVGSLGFTLCLMIGGDVIFSRSGMNFRRPRAHSMEPLSHSH